MPTSTNTFRTTKGTRVFLPKIGNRFSPTYTCRMHKSRRSAYFQLGSDKKKAMAMADQIAAFLRIPQNSIEDALRSFNPHKVAPITESKVPTVGELISKYRETSTNRSSTKDQSIQAIRRITNFIQGTPELPKKGRTKEVLKEWRQKADSLPLDRVTEDRIAAFRNHLIGQSGTNGIKRGSAIATYNGYICNASQLLTRKARKGYPKDLLLPEVNPFREVGTEEEPSHRFKQEVNPKDLIRAAEAELMRENPDAFAVFIMALFGGLSRSEMDRLPWSHLDFEAGQIKIATTEYYLPKRRNRESTINLPPKAMEHLRSYKSHRTRNLGTDPSLTFVLPGAGPAEKMPKIRAKRIFEELIQWLRKQGMTDRTPLHTLRKMAGSNIYQMTGSADMAAEFLRNDPRTAREHYLKPKDDQVVNFYEA